MRQRQIAVYFVGFSIVFFSFRGMTQTACTTLGQTPATAFPVCGTSVFKQESVPACGGSQVPAPCNDGAETDINPYWYKFTCFTAGTLGFVITPNTATDDYDWQLFDVTGHDPNDVYTDAGLFVSCNWSSQVGKTGTGNNSNGNKNCAGPNYPNMSSMPTLVEGHNYLLLVSHFTSTDQSGYSLTFGGGTASITDPTQPALKSVTASCDGGTLQVVLNKKVTCSSLAPDGSDFQVSPLPAGVTIKGASASSCNSGFDLDTLTVTLNGKLPAGNYKLVVQTGSDGNTLLDNCGNQIPDQESLPFAFESKPTIFDSVAPVGCDPNQLRLVFNTGMVCSTVKPDGSDFTVSKITGATAVSVVSATTNCDANGLTSVILLNLSGPIQTAGHYRIDLLPGRIFNECGLASPASSVDFYTVDTVSARAMSDSIRYGCTNDTVVFSYPSTNGVNWWQWIIDSDTSDLQNPGMRIYAASGTHSVRLTVSNGVCSDTFSTSIVLDNAVRAAFEAPNIICPTDVVQFKNNSTGSIDSWEWNFGDGTTSSLQVPADHTYPITGVETRYTVTLIVSNSTLGCSDTAVQQVDVLKSCYIAVPSAFTPNGDGVNDYLYPLNAFKADNLIFRIFNRLGQLVFSSTSWTQKWDGRIDGHEAPAGTYVWMLQYNDRDSGRKVFQKGTTMLIR